MFLALTVTISFIRQIIFINYYLICVIYFFKLCNNVIISEICVQRKFLLSSLVFRSNLTLGVVPYRVIPYPPNLFLLFVAVSFLLHPLVSVLFSFKNWTWLYKRNVKHVGCYFSVPCIYMLLFLHFENYILHLKSDNFQHHI